VEDMHERKAKMSELSDAFIALPGGFGTLEELLEVSTWLQLGIQIKPVAIYNIAGYFDPLLGMITRMFVEGFINKQGEHLIMVGQTPDEVLMQLANFDSQNFVPKLANLKF
jgi:hypothetical protein